MVPIHSDRKTLPSSIQKLLSPVLNEIHLYSKFLPETLGVARDSIVTVLQTPDKPNIYLQLLSIKKLESQ